MLKDLVNGLNSDLFELEFVLINSKKGFLFNWLKEQNVKCHFVEHHSKKDYLKSIFKIDEKILYYL